MKPHWLLGLLTLPVGYLARRLRNDPQLGASKEELITERSRRSVAWRRGQFHNLEKTPLQQDFTSLMGDLIGYIQAKNTQPSKPLPVRVSQTFPRADPTKDYLTWYGHSALRLESAGRTILLDPMLGDWVAPVPFLGHRFPYEDYNPLEDLSEIDLVVYSHDHFDHLDLDTLTAIRDRVREYLVPLGVGGHLVKWGIPRAQITEVDWWESFTPTHAPELEFTAVPARHFSGRSPSTRAKTLWCGFAIRTPLHHLLFGGDSGYGAHFQAIGERLGPFDLTMLDSGQYHDRWKNVHMQPEEALRAHRDVGGKTLLPIHWGGFSLSNHAWFDPVDRIMKADDGGCVISPMIGERFDVAEAQGCHERWWSVNDYPPEGSTPAG